MTPDQKPFYAATYIPKHANYGIPGLVDILTEVYNQWVSNREDMVRTGNQVAEIIKNSYNKNYEGAVTKDILSLAVTQFTQRFDHDYGGFGNEPKFPTPHNLMFLLNYAYHNNDEKTLYMVETTLEHMYRGGIYDHIGYGFSRYSTDARWLVPHFEKMLYDNALLSMVYLETYQYTKKPFYRIIAEQILHYINRDMTNPEGGFYSSQDADIEGVEGKYYLFKPDEITKLLKNDDAGFFNNYFDITWEGNFEGSSIPNRIKATELHPENERVTKLCERVYSYRSNRNKLFTDDKILTSWNSLMITAYATAAKILNKQEYLDAATKAVEFINRNLTDEYGRLYIRYRDEDAAHQGLIDDYAFFTMALLAVYEASFDIDYLKQAVSMTDKMIELFWDKNNGGFYLYAEDAEQLIHRPKEVYDGAIPSGNSVAGYVLCKIAHITGKPIYQEYADKQLKFIAGQAIEYPSIHSFTLLAMSQALYPPKEIVCVAKDKEDIEDLKYYLTNHYEPNTIALVKTEENADELQYIAEYTKDYHMINDKTTYYVCQNYSCAAPCNKLADVKMATIL